MNSIEGVSSRRLHKERPDTRKRCCRAHCGRLPLPPDPVWRRTDIHRAPVHRATADASTKTPDGYAGLPVRRGMSCTGSCNLISRLRYFSFQSPAYRGGGLAGHNQQRHPAHLSEVIITKSPYMADQIGCPFRPHNGHLPPQSIIHTRS